MRQRTFAAAIAAVLAACGPVDTSGSGPTSSADGGTGNAGPAPAGGGAAGGGAAGGGAAGGAAGAPANVTLSIVSPEDGQECDLGGHHEEHRNCTVEVAVSGAVLAQPGSCGSTAQCGHIDFFIDGTSCGSPNTRAWTTSFDPQPGKCPHADGKHTFSCELRNDRGDKLASSQSITVEVKQED